jgi:hypothetical protein
MMMMIKNTADVTGGNPIAVNMCVSAINPSIAFYDVEKIEIKI